MDDLAELGRAAATPRRAPAGRPARAVGGSLPRRLGWAVTWAGGVVAVAGVLVLLLSVAALIGSIATTDGFAGVLAVVGIAEAAGAVLTGGVVAAIGQVLVVADRIDRRGEMPQRSA